jgi:hypothetical protein
MMMKVRPTQMRLPIYHQRINADRWWIHPHSTCVKHSISILLSRVWCCVSHLLFVPTRTRSTYGLSSVWSKGRDCTRLESIRWPADLSCIFVNPVMKDASTILRTYLPPFCQRFLRYLQIWTSRCLPPPPHPHTHTNTRNLGLCHYQANQRRASILTGM